MVTPDSTWRTMVEVWDKAPKEFCVIQYVDHFFTAVERIINEEGAYVEEFDVCHDHRKATQILVQGGAITINNNRILTTDAELSMSELEQMWNTEMGVKVA